jgi:hypothetical protein
MKKIEFNKNDIEKIFKLAEKKLFDAKNIKVINYPKFDHSSFDINNQDLLNATSGNPIVYCIWTGKTPDSLLKKYIGHAGKDIARQRIRNHLTKKHERTGSQLEKVINQLNSKNYIGISMVTIEPAYMRKALEDWLIEKNSETLEWNNIGRKKTKK